MIKLNILPSYIKHSKVYNNLIENKVKFIKSDNIPLFKINIEVPLTFNNFKELLNTIYFWKIELEEIPVELFIFMDNKFEITKNYLEKYNNKLTKNMLKFTFDRYFLQSVISKIHHYNLLNYVLENNLIKVDVLFTGLCVFDNLTVIKYVFKKYSENLDIRSAIESAAENGNLNVVKFLLENSSDNRYCIAALIMASAKNQVHIVDYILNNYENITANDNYALKLAVFNGYTKPAELLLKHGANVHAYNEVLFKDSVSKNNLEMTELLLKYGANVHIDDDFSLKVSVLKRNIEMVKLLLKFEANIHAENDYAIKYASLLGDLNLVKLFLKYGADVHANDDYALGFASGNGHVDVVKFLLDNDAHLHAKNDYALKFAISKGQLNIVKVLLEYSIKMNDKFNMETLSKIMNGNAIPEIKEEIKNYMETNYYLQLLFNCFD